ncbi:MAG: hypothetical protein LC109_04555 [Bacteroidia bacterium]|nr:hypothetical protein [Bacteroidia bacterium]MCO5254364.1 hypothetical protein [Bacteroidota bacterium]MCZ2129519.1 hypothetical protein [Bacteroidia bacterium]
MKRLIAILFLLCFLNTNAGLGEMLKLPVLVHHYFEHLKTIGKIDFIDFMSEHYAAHINHTDADDHDHEKLPFRSIDSSTSTLITTSPDDTSLMLDLPCAFEKSESLVFEQSQYSNDFLTQIWQPPRTLFI